MGSKIDSAVAWAVAIANDEDHGYDQGNRWGPDYDCSSLVISAYEQAGIPVKSKYGAGWTGNMVKAFKKAGFCEVTSQINLKTGSGLKKGDVLWRTGHTEMMISKTKRVGAHSNENLSTTGGQVGDQTGKEIDVRTYSGTWEKVLRYPELSLDEEESYVSKSETINSNAFLSLDQMLNNALYIARYLYNHGWTLNAISGILGNMQTESTMNPGIWQNLDGGNTDIGYGLVQWTPATKLIEWSIENGLDYTDIETQLSRIIWEVENGVQYYPTDTYPLTFEEFTKSEATPEYLAATFLYNYERPAEPNKTVRGEQARYWFQILSEIDPDWFNKNQDKPKKSMTLFLMFAATRRVI